MKRFLSHCLAVTLVGLLAVGAPADVVQTTNPTTAGGGGGGGGGLTIGDAVTSGTATRVLFIDGSGNLADDADLTFATDTLSATRLLSSGISTFGTAADAANAVMFNETAGCITFEGTTADGIEGLLCSANQDTSDKTFTLPNAQSATLAHVGTSSQIFTGQVVVNPTTASLGFFWRNGVEAVTTTKTTTAVESGEIYTNTGDADGASITLLNDPTQGTHWAFAITVAQTLTIAPSAGETLYLGTDQCLVSISSATIGATLEIRAVVGGSGGVFFSFGEVTGWSCNDA